MIIDIRRCMDNKFNVDIFVAIAHIRYYNMIGTLYYNMIGTLYYNMIGTLYYLKLL